MDARNEKSEQVVEQMDIAKLARLVQGDSPLSLTEGKEPGTFAAELSQIFSTDHKARLAMTCRHFNTLFKPELEPEIKRLKQLAIDKLLTYVIRGNQAAAEEMIQDHPYLLLETGLVEDYSGRKIEGTALQLALGAEDVGYHPGEECMVEMIHKYLKQLPNGETIIAEQTAKQFPEGWQLKEEQRVKCDSDMLNEVINTIARSDNPADWEKAIHTLRSYLEFENKRNLFQTGKHFNHQLLLEALVLYNQNYNGFGGNHTPKNNIVWCSVIGTIERYITANMAQALCTGVGTIVDEKGKLKRTLTLILCDEHSSRYISYFPLNVAFGYVLGQDFAVQSYYPASGDARMEGVVRVGSSNDAVAKLMASKNIHLAALTAPARASDPVVCNLLK